MGVEGWDEGEDTMTRKTPIRHKVRGHKKGGTRVKPYMRGSGKDNAKRKSIVVSQKPDGNPSIKCRKFVSKKYKFKIKKPLPPIQICEVPHLEGAPAQIIIATDKRTNKIVEARIEIPPSEMYASEEAKTRAIVHEIGHVIAKGLSTSEKRKFAEIWGEIDPEDFEEDDFEEEKFAGVVSAIAMGGAFVGFDRNERMYRETIDWVRANIVQSDLPVTIGFYGKGMKVTRKYEY